MSWLTNLAQWIKVHEESKEIRDSRMKSPLYLYEKGFRTTRKPELVCIKITWNLSNIFIYIINDTFAILKIKSSSRLTPSWQGNFLKVYEDNEWNLKISNCI